MNQYITKRIKIHKKIHIGYFIKYNLFNIYKIWNINKNKIIETKDITFDENSCYNFINIDLNQFINELLIEINLFKLIQLNLIETIKINSSKKLEFNPYLLKLKSSNNIKSLNQITLHI